MKNVGRTAVVFLVLTIVILISGTAISLYLLHQETINRRSAESALEDSQSRGARIEAALKEAQKQIEILQGKNKDADAKINSLMDELELEAGLRDQMKNENKKLNDAIEAEKKSKLEIRQKLTQDLEEVQSKMKDLEKTVATRQEEAAVLQAKLDEFQKKNADLEKQVKELTEDTAAREVRNEIIPVPGRSMEEKVELDRIVVTPDAAKEGKVLNVDVETEFLIFDLGSRNGIKQGDVMSVYRGKSYLGDVKVSRVQEEMAAADFIPPFSSRKVRKNDQVVPKR